MASQINARDALCWSLSFGGLDSDSAEVGSMTNKLALAAQNAAKHLTYSQSVVEIRVLIRAWRRDLRGPIGRHVNGFWERTDSENISYYSIPYVHI
ncbi:hypothetical protein [Methylovirgula sp. 4M-Z18]|uniref:hypothetical protein n=1 Tax=Methylovirgula sp. 4M-Z18 TaxID=2293567 RepID=UPI000E2E5A04|nr:hypothetical protein [Methylovirgula sp. 4M-Z18]RFB79384.1 hypothetical protein DYH55_12625 [Methylovirgula sp. 4M-Z18]